MLVVDDGHTRRDWAALGVDAVLPAPFDRALLLTTLVETARPVAAPETAPARSSRWPWPGGRAAWSRSPGRRGWLVHRGHGRSPRVWAPASASRSGGWPADLCWRTSRSTPTSPCCTTPATSSPASRSSSRPTAAGCREPTRSDRSPSSPRRGATTCCSGSGATATGPSFVPGRSRRPLDGLLRPFDVVVADVDADLEGDDEVGSVDVEDRNLLARTVAARADLVLVSALPTIAGLRRLIVHLDDLLRFGVGPDRLQPVLSRAPRRARARAELAGAVARAGHRRSAPTGRLGSPLFVPERSGLDDLHRVGSPLPRALVDPVAAVVGPARQPTGGPRRDRRPRAHAGRAGLAGGLVRRRGGRRMSPVAEPGLRLSDP